MPLPFALIFLMACSNCGPQSQRMLNRASPVKHSEWTPPNSALLVRAGGARHRVQPLKRGERTIVKLVYKAEGSSPVAEGWRHLDSLPGLRAKQRPGRKEQRSGPRRR